MDTSMDSYSSSNLVSTLPNMEKAPMNIRLMSPHDVDELRSIHAKHYSNEFSFDDFIRGFLSAYVIEDDGGIISGGGLRPMIECLAITNKDRSVRDRREALYTLLQACMFWCGGNGHQEIHVAVQDEKWEGQLKRVGFKETKGKILVLCL